MQNSNTGILVSVEEFRKIDPRFNANQFYMCSTFCRHKPSRPGGFRLFTTKLRVALLQNGFCGLKPNCAFVGISTTPVRSSGPCSLE